MPKNFILAFGGTGTRCVEALTYLYASRSIAEPAHILIIDPDAANGNVSVALNQLHRYHAVQSCLRSSDNNRSTKEVFFSTALNAGHGRGSFRWEYPNQQQSFSTLIQYSSQERTSQDLLNLLYDPDDLAMTFEQGYVGRAHIGSLDLFRTLHQKLGRVAVDVAQLETSDDRETTRATGPAQPDPLTAFFRELRNATQGQQRANLMVLGSIFGGTGASGIPAIPPLILEKLPYLRDNLNIACVQVAPYFVFGPPATESDPDSSLHPLATQTALFHYAQTDAGYDRIYLLGAPERATTNPDNQPGGTDQRNNAHYVELAAALATAHFFDRAPKTSREAEVYACGSRTIDWGSLPHGQEVSLRKRLVAFATFCLFHSDYLYPDLEEQRHREAKWYYDLIGQTKQGLGGRGTEMEKLRDFANRFVEWATELQVECDGILLQLSNRQNARTLGNVAAEGAEPRNPYHTLYANLNRTRKVHQESAPGWYVEAVAGAVNDFCSSNYTNWWSNS
jgi:hypothetical protein